LGVTCKTLILILVLEQTTQPFACPNQQINPSQCHAYRIHVTNPESGNFPSSTKCVTLIFIDLCQVSFGLSFFIQETEVGP